MEFTEIVWKATVKLAFPSKQDYMQFMGNYSTVVRTHPPTHATTPLKEPPLFVCVCVCVCVCFLWWCICVLSWTVG
jgi:ATP/ADP translocase